MPSSAGVVQGGEAVRVWRVEQAGGGLQQPTHGRDCSPGGGSVQLPRVVLKNLGGGGGEETEEGVGGMAGGEEEGGGWGGGGRGKGRGSGDWVEWRREDKREGEGGGWSGGGEQERVGWQRATRARRRLVLCRLTKHSQQPLNQTLGPRQPVLRQLRVQWDRDPAAES